MPKKKITKQKIKIKSMKSSRVAPEFKPKSRSKVVFIIASLLLVAAFYSSSQKSGMGGIQVTSVTDATVAINGKDVGKTPYYVENHKVGENEIRITEVGSNLEWTEKINLVAGTLATMHQEFNTDKNKFSNYILSFDRLSDSNKSTVKIISNPSSATVTVDGKPQGFTPIDLELAPGPHVFTFTSPGYSDKVINAAPAKGYQLNIKLTMASLGQKEIVPYKNSGNANISENIKANVTPAPQDPNKPHLTKETLGSIYGNIRSPILDTIKSDQNQKIIFTEQKDLESTTSGTIGEYIYVINKTATNSEIANYNTSLVIQKSGKTVFSKQYDGYGATAIFDVKTNYQQTKLLQLFSYGAHCCMVLVPITLVNGNITVGEPFFEGNIDLVFENYFFVKNGSLYKFVFDDRFAYYGTSYIQSTGLFYPQIYKVDEKGFTNTSSQFQDYYKNLYQNAKREMAKLDYYYIDWDNPEISSELFINQIYLYTFGTLAGENGENLKKDLISRWPNLNFDEEEIFKLISRPAIKLEK